MNPLSRTGSRTARRSLLWVAIFIVAMTAARPAFCVQAANNVSVTAGFVDPSVDIGQPAEYHIDAVNGQPSRPPPAPQVDGLTISYTGENTSRQYTLNGFQMQGTTTTTYVYSIETSRAGRFTIPGQQLDVDGVILRTLPVTLTVQEAGAASAAPGQAVSAELIIPKKSAYIGESIPVEVRSIFGLAVHFDADPDPILAGEGFSVQKFARPRLGSQTVDGEQVRVVSYKTAIAGVKIGNLTIGPVELQPRVQMPLTRQRRRNANDPFNNPFFKNALDPFNLEEPKYIKLHSGTVDVEIKPLPPGKPDDFSGAVGTFKLEAEADPRKAQAGDPVTVRLVLSGRGNFDRIAAPVLSDERGLRTYPATSKFRADDEVNLSGVKTFEQVVIADGRRSSLPSYRFSYLDPATGKYVAIDTPPVPVEIIGGTPPAPAASVAPSAPVATSTPTPAPTPTPPPKTAEDILYIRTDPGSPRTVADFLPPYRRRDFWIVQGAVGLGLLGLAAFGGLRARARNGKARRLALIHRQQNELQRALRREDTGRGEFYSAATQLARLKAAVAADRPAGSLSVADICRAKSLDARATGSVEEIFHRHDELAYSGARAAREPVPADERRGVLATLETLEKR